MDVKRPIAVSGRFLRVSRPTGTQRSARLLLTATLPHQRDAVYLHAPQQFEGHEAFAGDKVILRQIPGSGRLDHLWEQAVLPYRAGNGVICTLMGTGPVFKGRAAHVMVVHDLNFILVPGAFSRAFRAWYHIACAEAARRADRIVCFTNYVAETIHQKLGIPKARITIIPQGPGIPLATLQAPGRVQQEGPYFLCVGSLQPHKNLAGVLAAWELFRLNNPGFRLIVVGRKQDRFSHLSIGAKEMSAPGLHFTGYVDDSELVSLYRGATGFIYPSFEEGFGLPVVEAFYTGCPVITSACSCLPEVAGGAALLVNPHKPAEIHEAMERLASDREERLRLRSLGHARAGFFSWESAGRRFANVLAETA